MVVSTEITTCRLGSIVTPHLQNYRLHTIGRGGGTTSTHNQGQSEIKHIIWKLGSWSSGHVGISLVKGSSIKIGQVRILVMVTGGSTLASYPGPFFSKGMGTRLEVHATTWCPPTNTRSFTKKGKGLALLNLHYMYI